MKIGGCRKIAYGGRLGLLRYRTLEVRKRLQLFDTAAPAFGNAAARNARAQRRKVEGLQGALVGERYVSRLSLLQLLAQKLVDECRIGLPARRLHHRSGEKAQNVCFAGFIVGCGFSVRG